MEQVGVKELKAHASEILRRVREDRESIEITYHGKVIAELSPVAPVHRPTREELEEHARIWRELGQEIGKRLPENTSAEDVMKDIRREL